MAGAPRLTLGYRVALLIAILLISSAVVTMLLSLRSVQSTMSQQSDQSVANMHASVESLIAMEYANIVDFRDTALERRKTELKDLTNPIVESLNEDQKAIERHQLTQAEAQANAKEYIKTVRFGNNDYFFAFDRGMTTLSHPDATLEGQTLIDLKDADGKPFIREMQDKALADGSGFVEYRWKRLGEVDPSAKLAYFQYYPPWNWILGTGVYIDDIDKEVNARLDEVKKELDTTLGEIRFSENGFFFIVNDAGEVVVAPSGRDLSGLTTTEQGKAFVQQAIASAPKAQDATTTFTADVALNGADAQPWIVNTSSFDALGWTLVSVVPQAELNSPARSLMWQQALLSLGVLALGLFAGLLMSRRMIRPVEDVTRAASALSRGDFEPTRLDKAAARTDEIGELARTFQRMGAEIVARERALREQVAKLKVEIDATKREEHVREITETDFFTDLTAKAEQMRQRMHEDDPEDARAE